MRKLVTIAFLIGLSAQIAMEPASGSAPGQLLAAVLIVTCLPAASVLLNLLLMAVAPNAYRQSRGSRKKSAYRYDGVL